MGNQDDVRARAIDDLHLAAQRGDAELRAAMRTAFVAGVEPFTIAEICGVDEEQVRHVLGAV